MTLSAYISNRLIGYIFLSLSVLAWGVSIPLNKLLLENSEPLITLILQLTGSVSLLLILAIVLKIKISWRQDKVLIIVMIGILEPAVAYYLGFVGVQYTTAMHTSTIYAMEPAGIVALNAILFRRKTSWPLVMATLVSIGGVAVIAADGYSSQGSNVLRGDILVFLGVMAASLYVSISSRFTAAIEIVKMLLLQQLGSLVALSAIWLVARSINQVSVEPMHGSFMVNAFAVGILQFGLSFLFYFMGVKRVSGTPSILILNMTPIVGIISSFILIGETISGNFIFGALIVFFCMMYTSLKENH